MDEQQPTSFGRYKVKGVIGKGAMGVIYLAEDPVIGRQLAIKVIQLNPGISAQEIENLQTRFEREFRSAGTLSHPNIVTVHDVGKEGATPFIAMEYVEGKTLEHLINEQRVLSFEEVADLIGQVCDGLDFAHQHGVVHRDVKPANILLDKNSRPKITDFGVAKLTESGMTHTGTMVGTPWYMSPEQVVGETVTGAADQFSVAVMTYQLLTRERPFTGERSSTVLYKIVLADGSARRRLDACVRQEPGRALPHLQRVRAGAARRARSRRRSLEQDDVGCDARDRVAHRVDEGRQGADEGMAGGGEVGRTLGSRLRRPVGRDVGAIRGGASRAACSTGSGCRTTGSRITAGSGGRDSQVDSGPRAAGSSAGPTQAEQGGAEEAGQGREGGEGEGGQGRRRRRQGGESCQGRGSGCREGGCSESRGSREGRSTESRRRQGPRRQAGRGEAEGCKEGTRHRRLDRHRRRRPCGHRGRAVHDGRR
jgi:serine/threonine protein kinase